MINLAQDSDGNTFEIWKQDQNASCGVASTWMARGLVRQSSFAEEEWSLALRMYRNAVSHSLAPLGVATPGPMTFNPGSFTNDQRSLGSTLSNFGFFAGQLAEAIRAEGIHCHHVAAMPGITRSIETDRLGERKPAIALIQWVGGGGHFVVAARQASTGDIVFLDPWSGDINEQPNDGTYFSTYSSQGAFREVLYLS